MLWVDDCPSFHVSILIGALGPGPNIDPTVGSGVMCFPVFGDNNAKDQGVSAYAYGSNFFLRSTYTT